MPSAPSSPPHQARSAPTSHPRSAPPPSRPSAIPRAPQVPSFDDDSARTVERAEERARIASSRAIALRTQVEELEEALSAERRQLEQLREQHESLQRLVIVRADRIRDLERSIAEQTRHTTKRERAHEEERAALHARIAELEAGASAAPPTDDLRAIRGIGPKLEERLREAGVTHYAQIAAWTDDDVKAIAEAIGIYPKRIHNADWIGSAKAFLGRTDTETETDTASETETETASETETDTETDTESDPRPSGHVRTDSVWPGSPGGSEAPPQSIPPPADEEVDEAW